LQIAIEDVIRERGPMTVAAFMDLALYHPEFGYYARAGRRSGRAGDFITSVDVGPLFGELLAIQIAEMFSLLSLEPPAPNLYSLVEVGAGDGRLSADVLRALRANNPDCYEQVQLQLVEASAAARAAHRAALGDVAGRLHASTETLPESFEGVLFANELLDAMPVHQVVMRDEGLREVFVARAGGPKGPALRVIEGEPSTAALQEYLDRASARLEPEWRVEIGLRAVEWMRNAARRLRRGFMILIDYGHEARELYSASHSGGTLTTFSRQQSAGPEREGFSRASPPWLARPGEQDITAHVDFTSIRSAAEAEGMTTIAFLDQTYFFLGLAPSLPDPQSAIRNPQLKTLIVPGGLGSTMKVLILGKGVGAPALKGCSFKVRAT
jgi:SAM-dependent MidA family methyltransferase